MQQMQIKCAAIVVDSQIVDYVLFVFFFISFFIWLVGLFQIAYQLQTNMYSRQLLFILNFIWSITKNEPF